MRRLKDNISSDYVSAANRLNGRKARKRIVAYVEAYDDIFFWRTVLSEFENDKVYFEVMLPARGNLTKGKKSALMSLLKAKVGDSMIACVDADYDYLLQGVTAVSKEINENPYIFHTYVYAIENYQCYAESLHNVAVMVTLNDHAIFDFRRFMREYSEICFPLFVWSVWAYRTERYMDFSLSDFDHLVELGGLNVRQPQVALDHLRHKVERKVHYFQQHYPKHRMAVEGLRKELIDLGVKPATTYLYMHGHHVFDTIVAPIMSKVCNMLRQERETEISRTAVHKTQMHNEMSCSENSLADVKTMLKKNMGYMLCPQFLQLQEDIAKYLDGDKDTENLSR